MAEGIIWQDEQEPELKSFFLFCAIGGLHPHDLILTVFLKPRFQIPLTYGLGDYVYNTRAFGRHIQTTAADRPTVALTGSPWLLDRQQIGEGPGIAGRQFGKLLLPHWNTNHPPSSTAFTSKG
jgi:hypothetical protein